MQHNSAPSPGSPAPSNPGSTEPRRVAKALPAPTAVASTRVAARAGGAPARRAGARPSGEALLAALDVQVPPVPLPRGYGWAMGALASYLVLIGTAYLALLAFLGWLLCWHLFQAFASLGRGPYLVFHLPMALLGGVLLVFLVKPVFFRGKADEDAVVELDPAKEPLLFAFVKRLSEATGAPVPVRIEVDCEPNAAARLRRGGVAGVLGRDLVLRFGLPLAASLPVRQFAGVLAHEFGHFNQRSGMRGSRLIGMLMNFFAKVVFERDRLDEKLARLRRANSKAGRVVFWLTAWVIEAARGVLWLMLVAGQLLTCGALRRMEYDADQLEAQIAGAREFVRTSKLLMFLGLASRRARMDLQDAWEQKRLADDLPQLVVAHARQLAEHRDDILKLLEDEKTSWFDTHPCHNDRVRGVQATGAAGLVACDTASRHLFADFGGLCRHTTAAFYRAVLGEDFVGAKLIPTTELVEQRREERQWFRALRRFMRNGTAFTRPVFPRAEAARPATDAEADELARELAAARAEVTAREAAAGPASDRFETSNAAIAVAQAKLALTNLFAFSTSAAKMAGEARADRRKNEPLRLQAVQELARFEEAMRRRLTVALRLAQNPAWGARAAQVVIAPPPAAEREDRADLAGRAERGDRADRAGAVKAAEEACYRPQHTVAELLPILRRIEPFFISIEQVRELALRIRLCFSAYDDERPYQPLVDRIIESGKEVGQILQRLEYELQGWRFPFAHATSDITIARALFDKLPDPQDPVQAHGVAMTVVERFYDLAYRVLAELANWAERVEVVAGLDVLAEPPRREDKEAEAEEVKQVKRDRRRYWLGYGGRAAAGIALVCGLVWLSVSPPELPAFGGGAGGGRAYRPASFRVSRPTFNSTYYDRPSPRYPYNSDPPGYRPPGYQQPRTPGTPTPGNPGYQPYQPPGRQPGGYSPPGYRPPDPYRGGGSPGGYRPPAPGGGGGGGYRPSPGGAGGSPGRR